MQKKRLGLENFKDRYIVLYQNFIEVYNTPNDALKDINNKPINQQSFHPSGWLLRDAFYMNAINWDDTASFILKKDKKDNIVSFTVPFSSSLKHKVKDDRVLFVAMPIEKMPIEKYQEDFNKFYSLLAGIVERHQTIMETAPGGDWSGGDGGGED